MSNLENVLKQYDYPLSPEIIALNPASPRDSAKLLVYDRAIGEVSFDTYLNLDKHLPENALLIFNNTKVIPARLPALLPTGGKVELLWIKDLSKNTFEALSPRSLDVGDTLRLGNCNLTVAAKNGSLYTILFDCSPAQFKKILLQLGTTPIPPYLKSTSLKERELRDRYQSIFAKYEGSAAAPTASLHFTPRLFAKIRKRKIQITYVTLHVGLGTFAPLTAEHLKSGTLHDEYFEIPPATIRAIQKAQSENRPIIAVGTTALRGVESAFSSHAPTRPELEIAFKGALQRGGAKPEQFSSKKIAYPAKAISISGHTTLFIQPGYNFKIITGLITNFHVPKSSLLMLVASLIGRGKLLALYALAASRGFRFFSFGDGMLIK